MHVLPQQRRGRPAVDVPPYLSRGCDPAKTVPPSTAVRHPSRLRPLAPPPRPGHLSRSTPLLPPNPRRVPPAANASPVTPDDVRAPSERTLAARIGAVLFRHRG